MIVLTHAVLGVLHACVWYFSNCTCSAQLGRFHMGRRSRNTLIIIIFYFFIFLCVFPSYISGVHHFWVRLLRM